jgi:hypothetical protein
MRWLGALLVLILTGCGSSTPSEQGDGTEAPAAGGSAGSGIRSDSGAGGSSRSDGSVGSVGGSATGGTTGTGAGTGAGGTMRDAAKEVSWPPIPFDSGTVLTLDFTIDRSAVPELYFNDLTLLVDALGAKNAQVVVDGTEVPSVPSGTNVMFSTSGSSVQVRLLDPTRAADAGKFTTPILKNDKQWAYSIGFDDNRTLREIMNGVEQVGYRGTLFLICSAIQVTGTVDESWTETDGAIIKRLEGGWSIGNHTWNHDTTSVTDAGVQILGPAEDSARKCQVMLEGLVAKSKRSDYIVTGLAAPMFDPGWLDAVKAMRDAHDTHLLFDESGGCCPGGAPMVIKGQFVQWVDLQFDFDNVVTRSTRVEESVAVSTAEIDKEVATVTPTHMLWINSLSHGGMLPDGGGQDASKVVGLLQYIHDKYGAGGSDTVWVAPSDEIYAYLEVQRKAVVAFGGSH